MDFCVVSVNIPEIAGSCVVWMRSYTEFGSVANARWEPLQISRYPKHIVDRVTQPITNPAPTAVTWEFISGRVAPSKCGTASHEQLTSLFEWFVVRGLTPEHVMEIEEIYSSEFREYLRVHWFQLSYLNHQICAAYHWAMDNTHQFTVCEPDAFHTHTGMWQHAAGITADATYIIPWSELGSGSMKSHCLYPHPFDVSRTASELQHQAMLKLHMLQHSRAKFVAVETV